MSLLQWREPIDSDFDADALWFANGYGGRYCIKKGSAEFYLFHDDDEFDFTTFDTIDECKEFAEKRFRDKVVELNDRLTDLILKESEE